MKIEVSEEDCKNIVEDLKRSITYKLNVENIRNEIINRVTKEIKEEILAMPKVIDRMEIVFEKCEKNINEKINNRITAAIGKCEFNVTMKNEQNQFK